MSALSTILRDTDDNGLMFMCPGCKNTHLIYHGEGKGERWSWNGDANKPTFHPSVLVRAIRSNMSDDDWNEYDAICSTGGAEAVLNSKFGTRCHSFVTNGRIQFLSDCTHELAGQTVDLPGWTSD